MNQWLTHIVDVIRRLIQTRNAPVLPTNSDELIHTVHVQFRDALHDLIMFESYPKGFPDFAPNTPGSWAVKQHFSRLADADIDIIFTQNYDNYLMQCKFTTIGKCHSPQNNWFQFLTHCIPKRISEPWLGDMCEMREAMRAEGYSERAVLWATVSQFALLLLHWGLSKGVDILTPFKKPKIE